MDPWQQWRHRAKQWKKDHQITDEALAAAIGRRRATINSWFNKREPNLSDFMALCLAMGADPDHILFGDAGGSPARPRVQWVNRTGKDRRVAVGDRRGNGKEQPGASGRDKETDS